MHCRGLVDIARSRRRSGGNRPGSICSGSRVGDSQRGYGDGGYPNGPDLRDPALDRLPPQENLDQRPPSDRESVSPAGSVLLVETVGKSGLDTAISATSAPWHKLRAELPIPGTDAADELDPARYARDLASQHRVLAQLTA